MFNTYHNLIFSKHALERMGRRSISKEMVRRTLNNPNKTFPGHSEDSIKFIKNISGRNTHVIATLLPEKKWLIVSVWVRGEEDTPSIAWRIISFPFVIVFKLAWGFLKIIFRFTWNTTFRK